jgi:hypothetical protein
MKPDFTPTKAWYELTDYINSQEPQDLEETPSVYYDWQRLRPTLAIVAGVILFFWLLNYLAPNEYD